MTKELKKLLEMAKNVEMSPKQQEEQRRSFAYGNTKIENKKITKKSMNRIADNLKSSNSVYGSKN